MKRMVAILSVLLCCALPAQDALSVSMERIAKTKIFAFGGVGFAGLRSEGEKDFRIILAQPAPLALASFEKVYATGNPEAKLYALAGNRKLDPNHFKELMPAVKDSKEPVTTMEGCIVDHQGFGATVIELDSGRYDPWIEPRKPK